jgi:CRP/FNR family transcriptional regulator, cyclic AMP receptor protein
VLFREGDTGDVMFAVIDGELELSKDDRLIDRVTAGGIVGEMALVDDGPRSATARARSAARVVRVDRQEFTFLVQEHPTFALRVMRVMADRLRKANDERHTTADTVSRNPS